jgi:PAS domain S-box-containing protein
MKKSGSKPSASKTKRAASDASAKKSANTTLTEEVQSAGRNGFRKILALLRKAKEVDFTDYQANSLHRHIARRMALNTLVSMDDYARLLGENAAEVEALYQDILINVTSFFRDPESFAVLKERIFPQIVEHRAQDKPVRIWVMGCSTGEEAYSIAISFVEFASDQAEHIPLQVFATDLNDRSIEKARAGFYSREIAEDVSPERLSGFFTEVEGGYLIGKGIREMVVFARHNILADPPFSRQDLISCQNLLVYLEPVLQRQVLPKLHYALNPAGILWVGSSEEVGSASVLFAPIDKGHRFYSKKPASASLTKQKIAHASQATLSQEKLAAAYEHMQSLTERHKAAIEALQSANEEIRSSNEELRSINDELETAKQELESGNEELAKLNDLLHNRNSELSRLNDDLNNLLSSVSIPILMLSRDLLIRSFTPQAEKVLSLIATDVGRPISDINASINVPDLEKLVVEVIDNLIVKECEVRDRHGRWYLMRVRPYITLDNNIDGVVILLFDINDLKNYSEAIVETIREPLIVLDENLRVRTANRVFYDTFHISPEETQNQFIYELGNRQWDIPKLRALLEEILPQNSQFQDFEVEHEFEGIGLRTMLLNARRLQQESSRAPLILLVIEDITERKQTKALRESAERLRFMAESMPQKIFTARPNGEVDYFNRQWMEFTGLSFEQIKNWGWTQFIHPDDVKENIWQWQRSIDTGEPFQIEHRFRRADGEYRWHLSRAHAMRDAKGKIVMWISSNTDIDDMKRAEEERNQLLAREQVARAEAEKANRIKDEFLAIVSHELRTPLHAMLGWVQMLRSGMVEEAKVAHALEAIERNAKTQNQLVADLLDTSQIIVGKLRMELGPIQLIPVIKAALETVRPMAEAKGVELRVELDPRAGQVLGDANRLQQIVWNLLANAIKYTHQDGCVETRLERKENSVVIIVRDTGEGISPEFLPHVFARFRQADFTTTRQHGGLGLGLAIVHHLVEAHGGQVSASSEGVGKGATFMVTLPLMASPNADFGLLNKDAAEQSAILTGLRVLVVDDNSDARELLRVALTRRGAEVRVGDTARAALDILKQWEQWQPDVLVSDIGMPGEDGYDLIRQVRSLPDDRGGQIPAVALTGYASAKDSARILAAGYQMFVSKPIDLAELVTVITSVIKHFGIDQSS